MQSTDGLDLVADRLSITIIDNRSPKNQAQADPQRLKVLNALQVRAEAVKMIVSAQTAPPPMPPASRLLPSQAGLLTKPHPCPNPPPTYTQCKFLWEQQLPPPLTVMHLYYGLQARDRFFKAVKEQQKKQQQGAQGQTAAAAAAGRESPATPPPPPMTNELILTAWADLNDLLYVFEVRVCSARIEPATRASATPHVTM